MRLKSQLSKLSEQLGKSKSQVYNSDLKSCDVETTDTNINTSQAFSHYCFILSHRIVCLAFVTTGMKKKKNRAVLLSCLGL